MSQEWKLVPVEPTENMVINGFESVPDEGFTDEEVWEHYQDMSGCQQAAFRAKLCWAAMLASAPLPAANVDPAVVGHFYEGDVMGDQFSKLSLKHYYRRHGAAEHEYIQPVALIRQEDHRTHMIRQQAEIAALQQRLTVADEQVDILSGGLRLMTSFGSGTNIAGVKTIAKQTLNRAAGVVSKTETATPQ
jgi:hypothetical protein